MFEGSISDREIVIKSGFLDYLEEGDLVLAARGFQIHDLVAKTGSKLVIPPFLKGRDKFDFNEETVTKIISKARIHIERYNERFKKFLFVNQIMPHYHFPLISQAVYVTCCLANFTNILAK